MLILAFISPSFIFQGMKYIATTLENLDQVLIPSRQIQGGAQKPYKISCSLSDIKCYICNKIGHYACAYLDLKSQQLRALKTLFSKNNSEVEDVVQKKFVTIVEEDNDEIILAAPVTLQESGVKNRP